VHHMRAAVRHNGLMADNASTAVAAKGGAVDKGDAALRVSVVVCTLRRPESVAVALEALAACRPKPFEVLVVDGDTERSAQAATAAGAGVIYVPSAPGLTHQRNVALAATNGDVVMFLDDDARPAPDLFARLPASYDDPGVVGATGRVIEPHSHAVGHQTSRLRRALFGTRREGTFTRFGYPRRLTFLDTPRRVEFMPGCFMSARLAPARQVGFDERLTGYGLAEDEDFSYRLSRLGPITYDPSLVVVHDNSGFAGSDTRSFSARVVVNRVYLFRKNFPQTPATRLQFAGFVLLLAIHRMLNLDGRGVLGIFDGVREVRRGHP